MSLDATRLQKLRLKKRECRDDTQKRGAKRQVGRCDYRWVADWQSVQSGLITCWNIWIDRDEDSELVN